MSQDYISENINFEESGNAQIKVFGVGGGGSNAVNTMIDSGLRGVQFICANTDKQALDRSSAPIKIQLGEKLTRGLGAGANPTVGREAANESMNAIRNAIGNADMVFVTAGMGGGTGTGAAPVIAQIAKEAGALTVGVVSKPFFFEGKKRIKVADEGLDEFRKYVDCLIIIPNDRLVALTPKGASFDSMLGKANEVLYSAVKGISDVIVSEGQINVDFADVKTTMSHPGLALMATGTGTGENRAKEAAQKAINSPLLDDISLASTKAILYNITASRDISAQEITEVAGTISEAAPEDAEIIFGVVYDDNIGDEIHVTVIATGIEPMYQQPAVPQHQTGGIGIQAGGARVTPFNAGRPQQQPAIVRQTGQMPAFQQQPGFQPQPVPQQEAVGQQVMMPQAQVGNGMAMGGGMAMSTATMGGAGMAGQIRQQPRHQPGKKDFTYEDDEFEIPAFIRTQAD